MLHQSYVQAVLTATESEPHRRDYAAVYYDQRGRRALATADGAVALDPVYNLSAGEEYVLQPAAPLTVRRDGERYVIETEDANVALYPGEDPVEAILDTLRDWGVTLLPSETLMPPPGHGLRPDGWGRWWYGQCILPHPEEHLAGDVVAIRPDGASVTLARETLREGEQYYSYRKKSVRTDWGKARALYEALGTTAPAASA